MTNNFFAYLFVMALVTYLTRMIPLVIFRKEITNRFVRSFLYYVPYAVLGAMTVPAVFYSTSSLVSASVGFALALVMAFFKKSLLSVALAASAAAFICELFI